MNNFCIDLNLPFPLFKSDLYLSELRRTPHSRIDYKEHFHPEILNLLDKLGLKINLAESFYRAPYSSSQIHRDVLGTADATKLNWVYEGNDVPMNWYAETSDTIRTGVTALGITYRYYQFNDVKLLHKQSVGHPSLLQVAIPHNISTSNKSRLCVSVVLQYKDSDKFVTFNESIAIFKNFMVSPVGIEPTFKS